MRRMSFYEPGGRHPFPMCFVGIILQVDVLIRENLVEQRCKKAQDEACMLRQRPNSTAVCEGFKPGRAVLKGFNFHARQKMAFARLIHIAIREA